MQDKTDIFLDFMNYKILRQILTSMESDYFLSFLRVLEYYHLRTVHVPIHRHK